MLPLGKEKEMSKNYPTLMKDLPAVHEPAGVYYYLSNHQIGKPYLQLLDKIVSLNDLIISNWLNITPRTLRNYRKDDANIKDNTKEHIVSILSLFKHGIAVFGDSKSFEQWLTAPNLLLDHQKPMDFLDTISGIRLIDNRLTAMEYGENA